MNTAFRQGMGAVGSRDTVSAERWFRQAVEEDPRNLDARMWLGQTLCANGARRDGVASLAEAGRGYLQADGLAPRLYEIVVQLQQWRAFEEALTLTDLMVERAPGDVRSRQMRAAALAMLNRAEEALEEGVALAKLAPGNLGVETFLASLEADAGLHAEAEQRLRDLLGQRPQPREAFRALKEIARLLDKRGIYDAAFTCLEKAGEVAPKVPEYAQISRAIIPDMIAQNSAGYSSETMCRWKDAAFEDRPAPVFVIGFFRSGTTLTQEVLAAHPDTIVADEESLINAVSAKVHQMMPGPASLSNKLSRLTLDDIRALRGHYWSRAEGLFGSISAGKTFIDKYTMNSLEVGLISTLFPDGKLIFMMRDPRDVCVSSFQQLMPPTAATVHLLTWKDTVSLYRMMMEWWLQIRPQLSMKWREFRYEDTITDFEDTYRAMFDYAGLPWTESVVEFHRQAGRKYISTPSRGQVSQPIYSSSLARWRRYAGQVESASETLAPIIAELGYPSS
ncbi:MAG: sulfotransferase [Pseudomonadota bacterium]